jgi:hypothetical protein
MKRAIFWSVMTIGLLSMVLSSPGVARADFFSRAANCPTPDDGLVLTTPNQIVQVSDVIMSAGGPVRYQLDFDNPYLPPGQDNQAFLQGFLRRGMNFVSNFSGNVQGQNLNFKCWPLNEDNTTTIFITIVGAAVSLPPPPPPE